MTEHINLTKRDEAMETSDLNVLIGGEAGQGLATVGNLLARSLVRSGYFIVVDQSYQSRIRGGHNTFAITFCSDQEFEQFALGFLHLFAKSGIGIEIG